MLANSKMPANSKYRLRNPSWNLCRPSPRAPVISAPISCPHCANGAREKLSTISYHV